LSSKVEEVVLACPPGRLDPVTESSSRLGVVDKPGVVVTVTLGWDPAKVSSVMDDAVSSELDGDVTWTSAVFGDSLETLAQATAPRAPTKRTVVMMPMSLRFMVASFGDRSSVLISIRHDGSSRHQALFKDISTVRPGEDMKKTAPKGGLLRRVADG
jgi:hypothetical protein